VKHTPRITLYLLALFALAQLIGVGVLSAYIDPLASAEQGKTVFRQKEIAGVQIEDPPIDPGTSFIYMTIAIIFGTVLIFVLMRYQQIFIWKVWFFLAGVITLSLAFSAFIPSMYALLISVVLAGFRVFRPHIIIHNLTELFTYAGLASLFVPIMNLQSAIGLLLFISLYDMYAVWQSTHMVALAQAQTSNKMFAGLMLPYSQQGVMMTQPTTIMSSARSSKAKPPKGGGIHTAILGGGDIGFPLFFIGATLASYGLGPALGIIPFVTLALGLLFYHSEKGKFYPAMPFVSMGCLIGLRIITLFW